MPLKVWFLLCRDHMFVFTVLIFVQMLRLDLYVNLGIKSQSQGL